MPDRVCSKAWAINAELCTRLAWFSTTPLGVPVDPDVYCRKASVSPWMSGSCQRSSSPSGRWQVASQESSFRCGVSSISASMRPSTVSVVSATLASASSAIAWMRSSERLRRGG